MKSYIVLVNGSEIGTVDARDYRGARQAARVAFGRRCDVIGLK